MSARNSLLEWLEEWREWTLAEREAIKAQCWPSVRKCQQAKAQLQAALSGASVLPTYPKGETEATAAKPLQNLLKEVVALEEQNRDQLARHKAEVQARTADLAQSARNLRRVRQSYAGRTDGFWQTYS
jgi:hypothetical protein